MVSGESIVSGVVKDDTELCFLIKVADSRIIPHIVKVCQKEVKKVAVMSNDTNVVI